MQKLRIFFGKNILNYYSLGTSFDNRKRVEVLRIIIRKKKLYICKDKKKILESAIPLKVSVKINTEDKNKLASN